jgi:hypothetical protein
MGRTEMITRSGAATAASAVALLLALFLQASPAAASEGACSNEALRVEQASTYLADCRAYELIAPTGYESAEPKAVENGTGERQLSSPEGMFASISGDRVAWQSEYPSPQSIGLNYLSTRGADGWSTEDVIPPQSTQNGLLCTHLVQMAAYSSELTAGVLADGFAQPGGWEGQLKCGHDEPLLVPGEPVGYQNLFLRDNENASYQLINLTPPGAPSEEVPQFPASFQAGSSDLSHVAFEEELPLAEGAGSGDELYDYVDGAVHLITYLPGGTPVHGILAGSTLDESGTRSSGIYQPENLANYRHAMSANGSRVFFEAEGALYARSNPEQPAVEECTSAGAACSVQIDEAQAGAEGPGGGGTFMVASEDGSRVFFTDANRLTVGSHAEPGKPDLYEYDFDRSAGSRLVDLTAGSGGPGEVLGVSGASGSGEQVYFAAEAALTGGQLNLYLAGEGTLTFIATLDPGADACDYWPSVACRAPSPCDCNGGVTARTSGNGAFIEFESDLSLTGYENEGPTCVESGNGNGYEPGRCEEIYLYSNRDKELECVSCDPGGAPPFEPAIVRYPSESADLDSEMKNAYPSRNVSESGQVFFESADPLVPSATNGHFNVYEYEEGKLSLISSGTSHADSYFVDASADGSNVFFATPQALVQRAEGAVYSMYDARVGGGFRAQSESIVPPECLSLEGCHSPLSEPPAEFSVASATLVAPGNLAAKQPERKTEEKSEKKTTNNKRKARLRRAINKCAHRYKRNPHRRRRCMQHVRERTPRSTKAGRHHGGAK